ncbi:hypothetical protein Bhyg_12774, partial [Pseudolycoriella hygida]
MLLAKIINVSMVSINDCPRVCQDCYYSTRVTMEDLTTEPNKQLLVDTTDDRIDAVRKRVMRIPELRDHIFRYLPLESIKACRLVCHEWNATAGPLLIATSWIRFDTIRPRSPDRFIDEFKRGELLHKRNKFSFSSKHNWIEYDDLLRFTGQLGDVMKGLKIYSTSIHGFGKLSLDRQIELIPSQLTKLEIVPDSLDPKLIVSMGKLQNIKTLRLEHCILEITDGAVCTPVELHLKNVDFLRNRNDLEMNVVKVL